MVKFECEVCGKQEEAACPNKYFVAPEGWYQTYDAKRHVCSSACVKQRTADGTIWRVVKRTKELVGPEKCLWCKRLGAVGSCPRHAQRKAVS